MPKTKIFFLFWSIPHDISAASRNLKFGGKMHRRLPNSFFCQKKFKCFLFFFGGGKTKCHSSSNAVIRNMWLVVNVLNNDALLQGWPNFFARGPNLRTILYQGPQKWNFCGAGNFFPNFSFCDLFDAFWEKKWTFFENFNMNSQTTKGSRAPKIS